MAERKKYVSDFHFLVLTGKDQESDGQGRICFSKISGIEVTMEQEEIVEGGKNDGAHILCAPHKKHLPLVLEQGVLPEGCWMHKLKPGMRLGTWLHIILLDENGSMTKRKFGISDGTIAKWEISGLDAMNSSILMEKIEIVHDGIIFG